MNLNLQVSVIQDLDGLRGLKNSWQALHHEDPEATVFLSWPWMWGRLETLPDPWQVLVARAPDGSPNGLLPLRFQSMADGEGEGQTLSMAGSSLADYVGFLCAPNREKQVLATFADYLQEQSEWSCLEIRDINDSRLDAFLSYFPKEAYRVERHPPTPCPFIDLEPYTGHEEGWEAYLREKPKSRWRRKVRQNLKEIHSLSNLRRTSVEDGGEFQISTMLELWQLRWGERPEAELAQYRSIFESCRRADCLWLDILWDGDVPISGRLSFIDRKNSRFCDYITCFDTRYSEYSPGIVIAAYSIQEAIRRGYRTFDFLRGDEYYKFALGAELRHTENVTLFRTEG